MTTSENRPARTTAALHEVATAIRDTLTSPLDANWESSNVVDAIDACARALHALGHRETTPFDLGSLGDALRDSSDRIADALLEVADAIKAGQEER